MKHDRHSTVAKLRHDDDSPHGAAVCTHLVRPEAGNPGAGKRPWKPDTYQKHAAYDLGKGILLRAKGGSLP